MNIFNPKLFKIIFKEKDLYTVTSKQTGEVFKVNIPHIKAQGMKDEVFFLLNPYGSLIRFVSFK